MKKIILLISALITVNSVSAQSKKLSAAVLSVDAQGLN